MSNEQKQLIREKWDEKVKELKQAEITKDLGNESQVTDFGYRRLLDTKDGHEVVKVVDFGNIENFWLNELDLAIKQTEESIVEVIKESRNVDEQFGVGIKEQQTRNQVIVDILNLIRNK